MSRRSIGLTDPVRIESGVGVKAAVSDAIEAANVVEQSTVALSDDAETGTSPHVPISTPPFSKETVPDG
jgi:hypothetical protein